MTDVYAIDVCAFGIMSNHLHTLVKVNRELALSWSEDEVLRRYGRLFPGSKVLIEALTGRLRDEKVTAWRERLYDLSWMMRSLNEWVARRANKEDGCKGRFWEGRFGCQPLLDEDALLTCMAYVDLNMVRAGQAETLRDSDHTSIQARLVHLEELEAAAAAENRNGAANGNGSNDAELPEVLANTPLKMDSQGLTPVGLMPFAPRNTESGFARPTENTLPVSLTDYVALLEWTGRQIRSGTGEISGPPPAIIDRLGINADGWTKAMSEPGLSSLSAVGRCEEIQLHARRQNKRWLKGQTWARQVFQHAA